MTVSLDVFRNFLRLLWDFQISKIHWMYLNQLNLFDSIESFWNDWIYLKQYSNQLTTKSLTVKNCLKIFPVKFQKVEFPSNFKIQVSKRTHMVLVSDFPSFRSFRASNVQCAFFDFRDFQRPSENFPDFWNFLIFKKEWLNDSHDSRFFGRSAVSRPRFVVLN